jgi:hypothetical protein
VNTVPENESASDQTRLWSKQFDRKDAERDFRAARLALAIVYRRACGEKEEKESERGGDNGRQESEVHNSPHNSPQINPSQKKKADLHRHTSRWVPQTVPRDDVGVHLLL